MVLWSNTLCSLAESLTPHRFVHLPLFPQCLPKQGKHSPCSFTLTNLSKTNNSLNLGQLCSLWHFPSPIKHRGEVNWDHGIDGHQNFYVDVISANSMLVIPCIIRASLRWYIINYRSTVYVQPSYAFWPSRTPHYELSWIVCLRLSRNTCLWLMDMLKTRSCMSLFVLFHQLQKILLSRPWRVALRMSEPGWFVTSCCLALRGRNCLSLVLESRNLRSALALFEWGTVTLNRRIVLGTSVLGLIITYLWVPILEKSEARLSGDCTIWDKSGNIYLRTPHFAASKWLLFVILSKSRHYGENIYPHRLKHSFLIMA